MERFRQRRTEAGAEERSLGCRAPMTPRKDAERADGNKAEICCAAGRGDFGIPVLLCCTGSGAGGGLTLCVARNGAAM